MTRGSAIKGHLNIDIPLDLMPNLMPNNVFDIARP